MNTGLRDIATAQGLSTVQETRLFAQTSFAAADALIACWNDKRYWLSWRPQTAIREAANDGNPAGLHFRTADVDGAWIGKKAAQWVDKHEFATID